MTGALDHIGIFVADLDAAIPFYRSLIDAGDPVIREVPELGLRLAFFTRQGGVAVELVEASGRTEMRHGDVVVALEVDDLPAEIARLAAAGIRVHHQTPTENLPLHRGWITKGDGHGTIVELCPRGDVTRFVAG
ncbi:VOC family protein [Paracoccus sp. (in: a-proteobacteria)]|uniref:VOC family protein n=1 Tax=Paracoccus sp. TaxID=267 RepID=UPI003A86C5C8